MPVVHRLVDVVARGGRVVDLDPEIDEKALARGCARPRGSRDGRRARGRPARSSCLHLSPFDGRRNRERLDRLANVVDAEHPRAALERRDRAADARPSRRTVALGVAEHARERALAREPDDDRPAERDERVEPPDELEVLVRRLPEADARDRRRSAPPRCPRRPRTRPAPRGTRTLPPRRRRSEEPPASSAARPACA